MRTSTLFMLIAVMTVQLTAAGCAKNASERRAASPTMGERIANDSVKGRVNDIGTKYVSIRNDDGESRRVRVDDRTKMDQLVIGDQVKAYVTEDGYASTIQRVAE
jgi:Cu/Ag efflux protein CusF